MIRPIAFTVALSACLLIGAGGQRDAASRVSAFDEVEHPIVVGQPGEAQGGSSTPYGYDPARVRGVLDLTGTGRGETVAVVTAFNHPYIAESVNVFSAEFGLPLTCDAPEAVAGDCFELRVMTRGTRTVESGWSLETALDVEWLHAIAPHATIMLVQAEDDDLPEMMAAVRRAIDAGATVVSASWGTGESRGHRRYRGICETSRAICVAAAGNSGNPGAFPASSPEFLAVGGTSLFITPEGEPIFEEAWRYGGGGTSRFGRKPSYQKYVHDARRRGLPDVAFHADPTLGYAVYDIYEGTGGWYLVGGTSSAAPQWAGIIAAANELRVSEGKPRLSGTRSSAHYAIYRLMGSEVLFDVTTGTNGYCGAPCAAAPGYDFVTGAGSPRSGIDVALAEAP